MEETDEGGGVDILTFPLPSFVLMHLISPPSSFVENPSFPINLHQSLYPCWVKDCTHYPCHVVYRNSNLSTDKCQVKQLRVTHKTAGRGHRGINHSQILDNSGTVNTLELLKLMHIRKYCRLCRMSLCTWMNGFISSSYSEISISQTAKGDKKYVLYL